MPRPTDQLPNPVSAHGSSPGHRDPRTHALLIWGGAAKDPCVTGQAPGSKCSQDGRPPFCFRRARESPSAQTHHVKDQPLTRHEDRRVTSWTGLNVFHCFRRISACQHAAGCMSRTVCRGDKMSMSPSSQSETPLSVRGPQLWAAEVTVSRRGGEGSPWLFTR